MPTVPRLTSRSVGTAPLPGVRVSPEAPPGAFGAPQEIDVGGVQRVAAAIFEDERRKQNDIAVTSADRQLSQLETELLYGAGDKPGALQRRGKDAFAIPDEVNPQWQKRVGEIEQSLTNDEQRQAFRRMVTSREGDLNTAIHRHMAGERVAYDETETKAYLENEREAALANYQDPARVKLSIDRQIAVIKGHARRNGLPPELTKGAIEDAQSKTHTGVISRLLATGQDLAASNYFKAHSAEIQGSDSAAVERALEEGSVRGESQRQADAIVSTAPDRAAAHKEAEKISDPKVRDAVDERIDRHFSQVKQAEAEQRDAMYLEATNILDRNPGAKARDVIPPSLWTKLSLEHRNALENRADSDLPNNDRAWLGFLDLTPQQMGQLSQSDFESGYWAKFDKQHRERAAIMWAQARDSVRTGKLASPELSTTLSFNDRVDNAMRTSGLVDRKKPRAKLNDEQTKLYAAFETKASALIHANEIARGKKLTGEEEQQLIDGLITQRVFVDKNWIMKDPERPAALVTDDERGRAYVPYDKIPMGEKTALENLMRAKGKRATTNKVQRAYAAMLMHDRALFDAIVIE